MDKVGSSLPSRAAQAISRWNMLLGHHNILVALSGGADSVALLLYLRDIAPEYDLKLAALHVNHMIRGEEADRDENFCRELCNRLQIPFFIERRDVPEAARREGKGLEECARDIRYSIISTICREHNFDVAALAHNADDNVETVLYNLTRGCALGGACGIPPVRGNIIRPLILCPKSLIVSYCKSKGETWVTDSTNSNAVYTRNRLRLNVIPDLKKLNPALCDSISSFCHSARRDAEFLDRLAVNYQSCSHRLTLAGLDDAVLSRVLLTKWQSVRSGGQLSAVHIREMIDGLRSKHARFRLSLPGGVTFVIERDCITLTHEIITDEPQPDYGELHGEHRLADGSLLLILTEKESTEITWQKYIKALNNIYKLFIHESVNSAKIIDKAYIRYRLPGDVFRRGGITRRIKVLFSDAHLKDSVRRTLPFVCDGDGIIWIPGFGLRDGMCASDDSDDNFEFFWFSGSNKPA